MDRKQKLASEHLFSQALAAKPLGDFNVVRELLVTAADEMLVMDDPIDENLIRNVLNRVADILLGQDADYAAVPGWNEPGKIDVALAEAFALDDTDPRDRVAAAVGTILDEAIGIIKFGSAGNARPEQWQEEVSATLLDGAMTLAGTPQVVRDAILGPPDGDTPEEPAPEALSEQIAPSKTQDALTRRWSDYP